MRLLLSLPLLVLLVLFALSNTQPVRLGLWPTDYAVEVPLSVAVLAGTAIGFLLGGFVVWLGELGRRHRARDAEHRIKLLESQVTSMRTGHTRLDPPA